MKQLWVENPAQMGTEEKEKEEEEEKVEQVQQQRQEEKVEEVEREEEEEVPSLRRMGTMSYNRFSIWPLMLQLSLLRLKFQQPLHQLLEQSHMKTR